MADEVYCRTLAEDFGLSLQTALDCLLGEPMARAYRMARWARGKPDGDGALVNWAKKDRAGIYAPKPEDEIESFRVEEAKPKDKASRFSGNWSDDIPPAEALNRMRG